jgi:hypothetical protein
MSSRRSASPLSNSDRLSDASVESDVSDFAALDASTRSSARHAPSCQSPAASRLRGSPKDHRPSPTGSYSSPTSAGKDSPRVTSPKSNFSPKGSGQLVAQRSPRGLIGVRSSLSAGAASPGIRSSPRPQQQAPQSSHVDRDTEQHSRTASLNMKDYLDDPLMNLRTNREHSDLVIRERDDEPHLRFMSLHFTPASTQAVNAFRSDWSEERDALLQDDLFSSNKRAAFFCLFSDKQSLQSPNVRAHILRPSEIREAAASDPDGCASQSFSGADANGTACSKNATPTAVPHVASLSDALPSSDQATPDVGAHSPCHAVVHNANTGASALCSMRVEVSLSSAQCLEDLPEVAQPASSGKYARPFQSRMGRPSAASPTVKDLPVPSTTEIRYHSYVTISNLGKERAKCCIVPSMQQSHCGHSNAADAPDMITPALGNVGQCTLEEFEEFYSKEWEELGSIDREIRCVRPLIAAFFAKICILAHAITDFNSFSFLKLSRKIPFIAILLQMLFKRKLLLNQTNRNFLLLIKRLLKLLSLCPREAGNCKSLWKLVFNLVKQECCFQVIRNQKVTMQFAVFVSAVRAWTGIKLCFARDAIWLSISLATASKIFPMAIGSVTAAC